MIIKLIWAQDKSGGIGFDNKLPWHVSEDLQNFKALTLNSTIVMGRKTWDSLKIKPLPKRRNIVLSSKKLNNVECYNSLDRLLNALKNESYIYIIGGAQIYSIFYSIADELHISFIDQESAKVNIFFPVSLSEINQSFKQISSSNLSDKVEYTKWEKK